MVDYSILKSKGLTNERLKQVMTAERPKDRAERPRKSRFAKKDLANVTEQFSAVLNLPEDPSDFDLREFFEERIQLRLEEAWERTFDSYRLYAAVDIAMDSSPINQYNWPLMMLAQGHINLEQCHSEISNLSSELATRLFESDAKTGKPFKVNIPKFSEISYNLVHSLVTRRVAAVGTPIATRFPFLRFDSRSTSLVGKLKAELMTQRAEIMSDQFGYRHDIIQSVRDASCYSHQVEFCRSSWDVQKQTLKMRKPKDGATGAGEEDTDFEDREVIVKEGIDFVSPHPTRVFYDVSYPLTKLNSDSGPAYIGYWDVIRFSDVRMNDQYYNRESVEMDPAAWEFLTNNKAYFQIYYPDTIIFPSNNRLGNLQSMGNDRKATMGFYAAGDDDISVTITQYFEKINPKKIGLADYDGDVWIRFVVGGNRTVIFAEVMPSSPACVYSYNENDSRLYSPSFAHQVMPFQDQISNLLSQLLEIQLQGLTKIFELNKDGMDAADISTFEDSIKTKRYDAAKTIILKYSRQSMLDMGIDPKTVERVRAVEISTSEKTTEIFKSIVQLLAFAERLLFFSPQELGQVAPREITATEANIVNNTTLGIRDFHTLGIEEGLAAKKRIICDATIALGSDEIQLPVLNRFPRSVVEKLGAKIVETDGDPDTTETARTGRFTLRMSSVDLLHDYAFTSRDGLDRPQSSAVAANLIQLLQVVSQSPQLQGVVSNEKAIELLNEISRNLGGGFDLKLELPNGANPTSALTPDILEQVKSAMGQVTQAITTLAQEQKKDRDAIAKLAQAVTSVSRTVASNVNTKAGEVAPGIPNGAPPLPGVMQASAGPMYLPDA